MGNWKVYVQTALFLAIAILFQSLRLIFPMIPGQVSMFLIGSLVNACLLLAVWTTKSPQAAFMALILPVVAFMQGQLPMAPMIPVVAMGTGAYALLGLKFKNSVLLWICPVIKMIILWLGTMLVLQAMELPPSVAGVITFMMSWPQLVTGALGIVLARMVERRIG